MKFVTRFIKEFSKQNGGAVTGISHEVVVKLTGLDTEATMKAHCDAKFMAVDVRTLRQ